MTGFLYYLPNHNTDTIKHEQIVAAGFGYAFENAGSKQCARLHGDAPGGSGGAIIYDPARIERHAYRPELQTWVKCNDTYWVGYWNDSVPGPDDLARKKQLTGEWLELGDERQWLIPIARRWSESDDPDVWFRPQTILPAPLSFGEKHGEVYVGTPAKRYAALWAICQADYRVQTGTATEADEAVAGAIGCVYAAVSVLQANYVVGTTEVGMLELFFQESPRAILDIFGDWATWNAIAKKKSAQLAEQRFSSGPEGNSPSTDQP